MEKLPGKSEILYALEEPPLGSGQEATVYRFLTNPDYSIRIKNGYTQEIKDVFNELINHKDPRMSDDIFTRQEDIFEGRNFAQTVAYYKDIATINRFSPGFSIEVEKPGRPPLHEEEALTKSKLFSKMILSLPDKAFDQAFDDLKFLSSKKFTIDVGGGFFCNTGNVLCSPKDHSIRFIDLQPFITQRPGVPKDHTKGFNSPLFLLKGLMPGSFKNKDLHKSEPELNTFRQQIIEKVVSAAERKHVSDFGSYIGNNKDIISNIWRVQLKQLDMPADFIENITERVTSIKDRNKYLKRDNKIAPYIRVSGMEY